LTNNCKVKRQDINGIWKDIKEAALTTIYLKPINNPDTKWKKSILIAEHSPIRLLKINWIWQKIKSFVSVHFVRHKIGIEHFVGTQREDILKDSTLKNTRTVLIPHRCVANAQAIINISRKRLCQKAHAETILSWIEFLNSIKVDYPELYYTCVPECVYRGGCSQIRTCKISERFFKNLTLKEFQNINKRYEKYHENKGIIYG